VAGVAGKAGNREAPAGRGGAPSAVLSLIAAGVMLVALAVLGVGPEPAGRGPSAAAIVLRMAGLLAGIAAVGYGGWAFRRAARERRLRAARAAAELASRAVAEERLRIARELHDVVAHSMGVIAVKAGTARYLLSSRPEEAGLALEVIETASRSALAEMRQMLGLLRPSPDGQRPELRPVPDLGDLPALVSRAAAAGVEVTLDVAGTEALPAGVGLSAYRIVQEAITNVIKHAAPAQCHVTVRADIDADSDMAASRLTIEVRDDGPGGSRACEPPGHGLIGMRERAEMHAGTFSAGPLDGGGFAVRATLPFGTA
jgi:signal transduction histidine kinase